MLTNQSIKQFRLALGWSRREFADAIPVDRRTVRRWESGCVRPSLLAQTRVTELMKEHADVLDDAQVSA